MTNNKSDISENPMTENEVGYTTSIVIPLTKEQKDRWLRVAMKVKKPNGRPVGAAQFARLALDYYAEHIEKGII